MSIPFSQERILLSDSHQTDGFAEAVNMEGLYGNLEHVRNRIEHYKTEPDTQFKGDSGFTLE